MGTAVSALMAINILLEPDEATRERARVVNAMLRASLSFGFALDETHQPHVTLLQRYVRRNELEGVFTAVEDALASQDVDALRLHALGLASAEFGTPPGTTVASLVIKPTPGLLGLQEALVEAVAPFSKSGGTATAFFATANEPEINATTIAYVEEFVPAHSGEHYTPHITVGVGRQDFVRELVASPFADFEFSLSAVGIYQLGNLGAARHFLRSWPLPSV